jgi:hypothetical protein
MTRLVFDSRGYNRQGVYNPEYRCEDCSKIKLEEVERELKEIHNSGIKTEVKVNK